MTRINTTVRRFPWHEDAPLPGDGKPKSQSGFENEIENSFSISAETTSLAGADLTTDPPPPLPVTPDMRDDYRSGINDHAPQTEADISRETGLVNQELDRLTAQLYADMDGPDGPGTQGLTQVEAGTDATLKEKIAEHKQLMAQARQLDADNSLIDVQIAALNTQRTEAAGSLHRTQTLLDSVNALITAGNLNADETTALNDMKAGLDAEVTRLTDQIATIDKQMSQLGAVKLDNTTEANTIRTEAGLMLEDIAELRSDLPGLRDQVRAAEARRATLTEQKRRLNDIDNDGIVNAQDNDADGDGINKWAGVGDPANFDHFDFDNRFHADLDLDGIAGDGSGDDYDLDLDADNDGYSKEGSLARPADVDDRDKSIGEDRDADGLDDRIERGEAHWTFDDQGNRNLVTTGGQIWAGVKNGPDGDEGEPRPELIGGTFTSDPNRKDTDGDGLDDLGEYMNGFNNGAGFISNPSDPHSRDTDGDRISDLDEVRNGTNPNIWDTDRDGLSDGFEDKNQNGIVDLGETNPLAADTDGDGVNDGTEANNGGNPANAADSTGFPRGVTPVSTEQANLHSDDLPMTADGKIDVTRMEAGADVTITPTNDDENNNILFQFSGVAQIDYERGNIVIRFNPTGNGQDIRTIRIEPGFDGRFTRDFFFYGVGDANNNAVFKTNDFDNATVSGVIASGRIQVDVHTANDFVGGRGRDAWWRQYKAAHPDEDLPEHQPWEDLI